MLQFVFSFITIALFAAIELGSIGFYGIEPNFAIISAVAIALLHRDFRERLILLFEAAILIKFYQGFELGSFVFFAACLIGVVLAERLPWLTPISLGAGVLFSTFLYNLADIRFETFFLEAVYNVFISVGLWFILSKLYVWNKAENRSKFR